MTKSRQKICNNQLEVDWHQSKAFLNMTLHFSLFKKKLEGGCSIPAFGYATLEDGTITLNAGLASLDGSKILRTTDTGSVQDAEKLGDRVARYILDNGGREMLAEIRRLQAE